MESTNNVCELARLLVDIGQIDQRERAEVTVLIMKTEADHRHQDVLEKKILEMVGSLSVHVKYMTFDIEASRRELEKLREETEE